MKSGMFPDPVPYFSLIIQAIASGRAGAKINQYNGR